MPIYEYGCLKCGKTTEVMQKFSDKPLKACPECGGKVKKLISNTTFVLKGTGWYVTDYAKKGSDSEKGKGKKASATSEKNKPEGNSEGIQAKSETKTESKSETKSESKSEAAAAK